MNKKTNKGDIGHAYSTNLMNWQYKGTALSELTPTTYHEEAVSDTPVITKGREPWNNKGMHTIDPHQMEDGRWIAIVDGIGDGIGATAP